jgi:hypothetical protein
MALVGSASVEIVPDARGFQPKLDAALRNIDAIKIAVEVATEGARAKIDELVRDRTLHIGVSVDTAAAAARLAELERNRTVQLRVDLDDAIAKARLDELARDRTATIRVNTVGGNSTNGDSGGGFFKGSGVLATLAAPLAALAIPVGAAGLGLGAALGGGALAAVGALGALKLGLSGVGTATKAVQAQQAAAGKDAVSYAQAQASAAAAVQGAQAGLANAVRSANVSAASSARAVESAQVGVADAQRSASASVVTALRSEASARVAVTDAQRTAAASVASAIVGQESAERSLTSAEQAETSAQNALTLARKTAQQQIEDLTNSVADGALAQRAAALSVIDAQHNLDLSKINPNATRFQQEQAQLAYDTAVQQVTDLATRQQRLVEQKKVADKAGVDGSLTVVAAQQSLGNATTGVATAQDALARANAAVIEAQRAGTENVQKAQDALLVSTLAVTEARRAGAESVAKAEQAVVVAQRAQADQAASSAASIASAQLALANAERQQALAAATLSTAAVAANTALAALTPAGRAFADFVTTTLEPVLKRLKDTAAQGILGGLQDGITALLPLMPTFVGLVDTVSRTLGELFRAAGAGLSGGFFSQFFEFLRDNAAGALRTLGTIIGNIGTALAGLLQAFAPVIAQVGGGIADLTGKFAAFATTTGGNSGFQTFLGYVMTAGPIVASALGSIFRATGTLIEGLAPLGLVMLKIIDSVGQLIEKLGPQGLLIVIGVAAAAVAVFTGGIATIAIAVTAGAAALVNLYQSNAGFREFIQDKIMPVIRDLVALFQEGLPAALKFLTGYFTFAFGLISVEVRGLLATVGLLVRGLAYIPGFGGLKDLGNDLINVANTTGNLAGKYTSAVGPASALKTAQDGLKDATSKYNTELQKNIDKFTILVGGSVNVQQHIDDLAASYDNLSTSSATNGASLDSNTAAGRANRKAIDDVALALNTKAQDDYNATTKTDGHTAAVAQANTTLAENRDKLLAVLVQSGFTQAGAQTYIDTLLQVPHSSPTQFETPGLSDALAGVNNLQGQIDSLHGANVPINIFGSYSIGPNGAAQFGNLQALTPSSGPSPALPLIGHADGGRISGPGTGTSDSILARLSHGEYVVKAAQTAKYLPMLEAMNSGNLPAFASGGPVDVRLLTSAALGAGVLQDPINGVYGQQGFAGLLSQLGKAGVLNAVSSTPGVGGSVDRWAPVILQALGLQGLPAAFLAGVENVIAHESGGNPDAINLTGLQRDRRAPVAGAHADDPQHLRRLRGVLRLPWHHGPAGEHLRGHCLRERQLWAVLLRLGWPSVGQWRVPRLRRGWPGQRNPVRHRGLHPAGHHQRLQRDGEAGDHVYPRAALRPRRDGRWWGHVHGPGRPRRRLPGGPRRVRPQPAHQHAPRPAPVRPPVSILEITACGGASPVRELAANQCSRLPILSATAVTGWALRSPYPGVCSRPPLRTGGRGEGLRGPYPRRGQRALLQRFQAGPTDESPTPTYFQMVPRAGVRYPRLPAARLRHPARSRRVATSLATGSTTVGQCIT